MADISWPKLCIGCGQEADGMKLKQSDERRQWVETKSDHPFSPAKTKTTISAAYSTQIYLCSNCERRMKSNEMKGVAGNAFAVIIGAFLASFLLIIHPGYSGVVKTFILYSGLVLGSFAGCAVVLGLFMNIMNYRNPHAAYYNAHLDANRLQFNFANEAYCVNFLALNPRLHVDCTHKAIRTRLDDYSMYFFISLFLGIFGLFLLLVFGYPIF